jgi:hypothetical protein
MRAGMRKAIKERDDRILTEMARAGAFADEVHVVRGRPAAEAGGEVDGPAYRGRVLRVQWYEVPLFAQLGEVYHVRGR